MSKPLTIAYVIVYHGNGRFPAMAYLSAAAARRVEPNSRIVLVTDTETPHHLRKDWPKLLELVDETIPVPASMELLRARSFYLKTRVRDVIDGDFIYLDSDTLPVRPFADMTTGDWDVALIQDRTHHSPITPIFPHWVVPRMKRAGWNVHFEKYFNAGLGFYRDNAAVRALVADWQRRWHEFYALGDDCDQVPLNCSLATMPLRVHELPPAYNAMVTVAPVLARGAKIYHFFTGNRVELGDSLYEYLLQHLQETGIIDWETIDECVALDHPWMPPYWPRRLWQTGNRWRAVKLFLKNLPQRGRQRPPTQVIASSGGSS